MLATPESQSPPDRCDHAGSSLADYQFANMLGSGVEARVFRVHSMLHNRDYAAKVFLDIDVNCTNSVEIIVLRTIDHPNVIRLYDHMQTGHHLVLLFELCHGGTLMDELRRYPDGFGRDRFVEVSRQLVAGLRACHAVGVSHGDLKGENILFRDSARRHVCLADFGAARRRSSRRVMAYGTQLFAPPEMRECNRGVDRFAADVWALGMVFLEMLRGKIVWSALPLGAGSLSCATVGI